MNFTVFTGYGGCLEPSAYFSVGLARLVVMDVF